jgi:hypothetical protein
MLKNPCNSTRFNSDTPDCMCINPSLPPLKIREGRVGYKNKFFATDDKL